MSESPQSIQVESIHLRDVAEALSHTRLFAETPFSDISGIDLVERVTAKAGAVLVEAGEPWKFYWLVLQGETCAKRPEGDGTWTLVGSARTGDGFGETPLLTCRTASMFRILAVQDSVLLRFSEQDFWSLLACCPAVRKTVLDDSAQRLQTYQVEALHREKLVSLGTLAAGLMHELNNPGSAAKRAASQLRENLLRLQEISLRGSAKPKTPDQIECMKGLLEHALHGCNQQAMSSVEQADAEEAMSEWLAQSGVENAYTIGPVLVSMGFDRDEIACAKEHFDASSFSDALNWFGALVSSVSLVCAIEESIARINELVVAVKKFAYDERTPGKELDVHDSLQSTLTILGHKLRLKEIQVEKRFAASPSHHPHPRLRSQPGVDQSHRQRRGCFAGRREDRNCHVVRARPTGGVHRRSRFGHSARRSSAHLRAVLHHQARGIGHWTRPRNRAPHHHAEIRRND